MVCALSEDSDQPGIRPVWSESSLCTQWIAKDQSCLHADSEDSDQTGLMPRLIWVFTGRTITLLILSWGGSFVFSVLHKNTHYGYSLASILINTHNICFYGEIRKTIIKLSNTRLICLSEISVQAYDNQISQLKVELKKEMEHEPIKGTVKPQIKQPKVSPPKVPQKKTEVTPPKQKLETDSSGADSTQVSPSLQEEDKGKNSSLIWICESMTKPTKWLWVQRRLRSALTISPVGSVFTFWVARDQNLLQVDSEDWSDWVDAWADPSLCWALTSFCCFSQLGCWEHANKVRRPR